MRKEYINGTEVKIHDVASAKQAKILELKMLLDAKLKQGFMTHLGFKIDCLSKSVADFAQNLQYMESASLSETDVMDYENKLHEHISFSDYKKMCIGLGTYVFQLRKSYWAEREKIQSLSNFNKIKAYKPTIEGD